MSAQRILMAVGLENLENALKREFSADPDYQFIKDAVLYREAVESKVYDENPDILILREGLQGGLGIKKLLKNLRLSYNGRILFIAEDHGKDTVKFLKGIFNFGIYDIVWGGEIDIADIVQHIRKPATCSETMLKLGLDRMDEEEDIFDSDYVSARIIQKQSPSHATNASKQSLAAVKKQKEVVDGEIVESSDNINLSDRLHPDIQRSSENSSQQPPAGTSPSSLPPVHSSFDPPAEILTTPAPQQRLHNEVQKPRADSRTGKEFQAEKKMEVATNVLTSEDLKEMAAARATYFPPAISPARQIRQRKCQSIMFLGTRDGVGCTTIAFNMALMLAAEGNRVIYIDFREEIPSQVVRLDVNPVYEGLDKFIMKYKEDVAYLDRCKMTLSKTKVKLPDLDILGFSSEFAAKGQCYNWQSTFARTVGKIQGLYDYVVCDVLFTQTNKSAVLQLAKTINKIAIVTTQDSFVGTTTLWAIQWLKSNGLIFDKQTSIVASQFENIFPFEKDIQKIFKIDTVFRISEDRKGMLFADSNGIPYMFGPKLARVKNRIYFQKIRDWIAQ